MPKKRPIFLTLQAVYAIHSDQISTFGGTHGLRDQGLLESAIGQAQHTFSNTKDIYQAAAQYCISLAKNHAFLDGNKRTAADVMLTFLLMNRIDPRMTQGQLFEWALKVAMSEINREQLAALLKQHSKEIK